MQGEGRDDTISECSTLGALTWDLGVQGRKGEQVDCGHTLQEKLLWDPGARHVRYAVRRSTARWSPPTPTSTPATPLQPRLRPTPQLKSVRSGP